MIQHLIGLVKQTALYKSTRIKVTLLIVICLALLTESLLQSHSTTLPLTGGCLHSQSPDKQHIRQTHCPTVANQTPISSGYFIAKESGVQFSYFGRDQNIIASLQTQSGQQRKIPLPRIIDKIQHINYLIPAEFQGQEIRIRFQQAHENRWFSIGGLKNDNYNKTALAGYMDLFYKLITIHIIFVFLMHFLQRKFQPNIAKLLLPVTLGAAGYLAFFAYLTSHLLGVCLSSIFFFFIIKEIFHLLSQPTLGTLKKANADILIVSCFTLLILTIGFFPYPDTATSTFVPAAKRWRDLPVDNWIPKLFADMIWNSNLKSPILTGWLSSDRPPLQTGMNLLFFPLSRSGEMYQVLSMTFQALIFIPVVYFLKTLSLKKFSVYLIILGLAMSSLFAQHTIFVWPKLISATFIFITYILLISDENHKAHSNQRIIISGCSSGFAMLCHGGALFGLLPVYLLAIFKQRFKTISSIILSGIISIIIYCPWVLYQKLIDPPGNRLVKWHLAGMPAINDLSVTEAIIENYKKLTLDKWISNKLQNLDIIFDYPVYVFKWLNYSLFQSTDTLSKRGIESFLEHSFANFFFSFWFLSPLFALLLFIGIGWVKRYKLHSEVYWLIATSIIGLTIWLLLIFLPGRTSIHHGTFFLWITFYISSCLLLNTLHRFLLSIAIGLNIYLFTQFYVLDIYHYGNKFTFLYIVLFAISVCCLVYSVHLAIHTNQDRRI